jgi:hypothetical protein
MVEGGFGGDGSDLIPVSLIGFVPLNPFRTPFCDSNHVKGFTHLRAGNNLMQPESRLFVLRNKASRQSLEMQISRPGERYGRVVLLNPEGYSRN